MFRLTLILSLFVTTLTFSQELACTVTVDARQTGNENLQIFRSLQTQLTDFINNTKWTNRNIKNNERSRTKIAKKFFEIIFLFRNGLSTKK